MLVKHATRILGLLSMPAQLRILEGPHLALA